MKRNKSGFYESEKTSHRLVLLRGLIVAACLIIIGAGFALLASRNSRAAMLLQENGKASPDGLWQDLADSSLPAEVLDQAQKEVALKAYRTVRLQKSALMNVLVHAPLEFTAAAKTNPVELTLPLPDGKFGRFRIVESPMLEPDFAAQFPEIKTYSGQGIDDPTATTRFDLTIRGFHAIILSSQGTIFVAPALEKLTPDGAALSQLGETAEYISYFQRDDPRDANGLCNAEDGLAGAEHADDLRRRLSVGPLIAENGPRRTYRTAVAATAEYTAQNGATVALARAAIVTSINGVNAIYNVDVNVQLMLINNTNIIYTNAMTDPYTTQNTGTLIAENQANLDNNAVLGSANYDIGHVYDAANASGGASGQASIATTCAAGTKGRGTTGGGFVLLAAHEMGHQFGATHTFNDNSGGLCAAGGNQRTAASAYEPGSGSTVMSYGGTCGAADLQQSRDSYFHIRSLEQIYGHISGAGVGNTCDVETPTGNGGIAISQFSPSFNVPDKTPFRLSGQFDDVDSAIEMVTWEEYDLGAASPPEIDNGNRPIFRSYLPSATQSRTFPRMDYILASNTNTPPATYVCGGTPAAPVICLTGEARTETTRTMTFIGTARDNAGAVFSATVQVNVLGGAGPFAITTPNSSSTSWTQGTRQNVVWARGNTASAPINCENVRISISPNGGISFFVLAESTPNDGSESVVVPDGILFDTDSARIKIESVIDGNFNSFFDINDANFSINPLGVTNTNDSGPGSFRQAIQDANSDPGLTKITFDIPTAGVVHTINLQSGLPLITSRVDIDGTTQPGYAGFPLIRIDGANPNVTIGTVGLILNAGNSTIRGLSITRFSDAGIKLQTNGGNSIRNCYIGTDPALANGLGNGGAGVFIDNTPDNHIGEQQVATGNVIGGNNVGILISGTAATANEVRHNYIGTSPTGVDLGNTFDGVRIVGAPNNLIGGTRLSSGISFPTGNVISGNGANNGGADGIEISGSTATGNRIEANFIGLAPTGTAALSNMGTGVYIDNAPNTIIGGATGSTGNYISGNGVFGFGGIALIGSGSSGTKIQGNYLGTNVAGDAAVANHARNIHVESANNQIGGTTPGERNIISGFDVSGGLGIYLQFAGATGNVIQGNYIGTDATGTLRLSRVGGAIEIRGAANNTIGGTTPAARNIISGNGTGISIVGGSSNIRIEGNYIGTNPAGDAAVPNSFVGVVVEASSNITIGGTAPGAGNVISGNGSGGNDHGIRLAFSTAGVVQGNRIGTNAAGTVALGNGGAGIQVFDGNNNLIGGTNPAARNIISGNRNNGIWINANNTTVHGNYIGTDAGGTADLGNGDPTGSAGIEINGISNTIGGSTAGAGNIIAFNGGFDFSGRPFGVGVRVFGTNHRIRGNSIFGNAELGIDLVGGNEGSNGLRVTANDSCDVDTGLGASNNLQNYPVISSAVNSGLNTTIQGTLNSAPGEAFAIDFYSSPACEPSGNGEGQVYLGSTMVNTDAGCSTTINVALPVGVLAGHVVTATATDALGNTSEFSSCVSVQSSIPTPVGNNVVVKSSGVTITFPSVTAPGSTMIMAIDPASAGALPGGYSVCPGCPAFEINTLATYTPPVSVCIDIPAAIDQPTFNLLKLLHSENGTLVDRTTGRQTDPQTSVRSVCGSVNSLSPFLIAQGPAATPTPTPTPTSTPTPSPTPMVSTLQFSASNYNGTEDCAATVVTVSRIGDSSGAASVDYATSDGSALQRTDYTIAVGTLTFASGETSRSFVVLITEDSFTEGTETASITLSNPTGGAVLGSLGTATLTILDDATEGTGNPIDLAGNFVCQHYHDFLNREADAAGLAFWTNEITSCGSDAQCIERKRINVSAAYFLSIEFQQTGYLVYRYYNAALNRSNGLPGYLEFLRDTQTVGRDVVVGAAGWEAKLAANKVAFTGEFVTRAEFTALYSLSQTPAQYVDALYAHAGITPTAPERQAALDEFAGATASADAAARGRVLRRVTENQQFSQREFNRAFVLMQYFGYLRRNPIDLPDNNLDGYNFWLGKLNQFNGDFVAAEMVKAFINSGEYRNRFR